MTTFGKLRENWQSLGSDDPLWAILSDPRAKGGKWAVDEFLRSGQTEIDRIFTWLQNHGLKEIKYGSALDFGCGAGRLTQALAKRFDRCTGVDVAASMLAAARRLGPPENCEFVLNERPDLKIFADERFDFIYSSIVLQHIPDPFAVGYIAEFCRLLTPQGVMVFQIPVEKRTVHPLVELKARIAAKVAIRSRLRRLLGHQGARPEARIEMHIVPMDVIAKRLRDGGVTLFASAFTNSCDSSFNGELQIINEPRYFESFLSGLFVGRKG